MKNKGTQNFFLGGGGGGKVSYGICTNGKYIFNSLCAFATNSMLVLSFT